MLIALQFKANKPEYGMYIGFAISILIFFYGLKQVQAVMQQFDIISGFLGESQEYLTIILRVIGVTYICEFSAGICKDAGYSALRADR